MVTVPMEVKTCLKVMLTRESEKSQGKDRLRGAHITSPSTIECWLKPSKYRRQRRQRAHEIIGDDMRRDRTAREEKQESRSQCHLPRAAAAAASCAFCEPGRASCSWSCCGASDSCSGRPAPSVSARGCCADCLCNCCPCPSSGRPSWWVTASWPLAGVTPGLAAAALPAPPSPRSASRAGGSGVSTRRRNDSRMKPLRALRLRLFDRLRVAAADDRLPAPGSPATRCSASRVRRLRRSPRLRSSRNRNNAAMRSSGSDVAVRPRCSSMNRLTRECLWLSVPSPP